MNTQDKILRFVINQLHKRGCINGVIYSTHFPKEWEEVANGIKKYLEVKENG